MAAVGCSYPARQRGCLQPYPGAHHLPTGGCLPPCTILISPSGRISPHPDSSLPFAYFSVISLASRFGSLCEGQEIKAVEWPENNRHSVAAAVPPQQAGPCRKRSAGGMGPQPLVPASIVPEGESAWTRVVTGGWQQWWAGGRMRHPSARWDAAVNAIQLIHLCVAIKGTAFANGNHSLQSEHALEGGWKSGCSWELWGL